MKQEFKKKWSVFKIVFNLFLMLSILSPKDSFAYNINEKIAQLQQKNAVKPPRVITGKVIDIEGVPIPGVNVLLKGTKFGALTDLDGNYKLTIPENVTAKVIVFSSLSYKDKEAVIGKSNNYDVVLLADVNALNEVVVIGYGSVAKKDLTGAVSSVNVKDLQRAPVISFDQALAGRVAGVQVTSNDGQPGAGGVNIVIRGANSLTQNSGPLYVVDGFPLEDFDAQSVNPQEIESITVLKDASSTAIYGARGANGVIVIETKKGKEGAPTVEYSSNIGVNNITKRLPMMDGYEFVKYQIERNGLPSIVGYTPGDLDPTNPRYVAGGLTLENYRNLPNINWQDRLFEQGQTQIHNISIRGGSQNTKYSLSGSIYDETGVISNSGAKRYQGRLNLRQNLTKKLVLFANINYSHNFSNGQDVSSGGQGANSSSFLLYGALGFRPVPFAGKDLEDLEDGLFDPDAVDLANEVRINPFQSAQNELRESRTNQIVSQAFLEYNFSKSLSFKMQGGLSNSAKRTDQFYNSKTSRGNSLLPFNDRGVQGFVNFFNTNTISNENTLTYKKIVKKIHNFNLVAGSSLQDIKVENFGLSSYKIPIESLGISGIDLGTPNPNQSSQSISKLLSYFGRLTYNYAGKYFFTGTYRADGSSKFATNNRWGYFPSAALSWKMSKEKFMKNLKFVSESKLRLSYGESGNNRVSDYAYLASFNFPVSSSYSFNNGTPQLGAVPLDLSNNNLKWETTRSLDIGYDLELFNSRVSIIVDWYRKVTDDLLLRAELPYTSGYNSAFRNIGSIENSGFDVTLSTVNVKTDKFEWTSNFTISANANKILSLSNNQDNILTSLNWDFTYRNNFNYVAKVGQPASQFFGYIFDGIYQTSDFDGSAGNYVLKPGIPNNGDLRSIIKPGDIRYKDINQDGVVDAADQTVIGRTQPKHFGGLMNTFSYAGFTLGVFMQWSYGNEILNANRLFFEGSRSASLNQFATFVDRWTPTNPSNTLPGVLGRGPDGIYSSRVIEDGSFLRLKTVSLDYNLSQKVSDKLKVSGVNLSVSAQNLFTWTKYSGSDPEVSVRNSTLTPGFDFSAYPRAQTVVFGIKVKI